MPNQQTHRAAVGRRYSTVSQMVLVWGQGVGTSIPSKRVKCCWLYVWMQLTCFACMVVTRCQSKTS
jgi:hypothetical protein